MQQRFEKRLIQKRLLQIAHSQQHSPCLDHESYKTDECCIYFVLDRDREREKEDSNSLSSRISISLKYAF